MVGAARHQDPPAAGGLTLVVRIAISAEAFAAISATLPLGSVSYENKTNDRGERYVWLETPRPGAAKPDHSAPGLGFRLSYDTNCQIKF